MIKQKSPRPLAQAARAFNLSVCPARPLQERPRVAKGLHNSPMA